MTIAQKHSIAKAATFVTGISLAFGAFAPALNAQTTTASLQAQLAALLAQVQTLQAQIGNSGGSSTLAVPSTSSAPAFTRSLAVGSTGSDVTALQNWLITKGYSIPAGASGYFGAQTQSAVSAWQRSAGLPTTGYFGPASEALVVQNWLPPQGSGLTTGVPGCVAGAMYSTVTGQACAAAQGTVMQVVPGCVAGVMYSTVTGQACASTQATSSVVAGGDPTLNSQMSAIDALQAGLNSDVANTSDTSGGNDTVNQ